MATPGRLQDPPVGSQRPRFAELERVLREQPFGFDFFQAVRLLGRILADRQPVGQFSNPRTEVVRSGRAPISVPPQPDRRARLAGERQPLMRVNFMGLTGPHGVLPLYYSALVRERLRARDAPCASFWTSLTTGFSRSSTRLGRSSVHGGLRTRRRRPLSPHLMDLLGLGTAGLEDRQQAPDEALVFPCGLLSAQTRSATALRLLLMDYFEVPVEIEQFVGAWHSLEEDTQCRFSDTASYSEH